VAQLVDALHYTEGRRFDFQLSLEFFIDIFLPAVPWLGVDSASNSNEYQEYFLAYRVSGVNYGIGTPWSRPTET
jgi:hypothetical protein